METKQESEHGAQRVKDQNNKHNDVLHGLSSNMANFYNELTTKFPDIRVTSGRRDTSPSGGFSHHHNGDAIDIGREHSDVYNYLYNTKEGLELMTKYGLGIYDETNPENMAKTNATGPHFHIGKDSVLAGKVKSRYDNYDNIVPVHSFFSQNPNYDYKKPMSDQQVNKDLAYNTMPMDVVDTDIMGMNVVLPNDAAGQAFLKSVEKEKIKEQLKEERKKESDARKALEMKQKEQEQKEEFFLNSVDEIRKRDAEIATSRMREQARDQSVDQSMYDNPSEGLDLQTDLPDLPNLFSYE